MTKQKIRQIAETDALRLQTQFSSGKINASDYSKGLSQVNYWTRAMFFIHHRVDVGQTFSC